MKGRTNNPNGRPAGIPNKLTKELRQIIKNILDKEYQNLPALLESLEPKDRIDVIINLSKFVLPKIREVSYSFDEPDELDEMRMVFN